MGKAQVECFAPTAACILCRSGKDASVDRVATSVVFSKKQARKEVFKCSTKWRQLIMAEFLLRKVDAVSVPMVNACRSVVDNMILVVLNGFIISVN